MFDPAALALATRIGDALAERDARLAIAETTAGGLVSAHLLAVPGASRWFDRGVVAYTGHSKQDTLGVSTELLREHGSVSAEAVEAMAAGLRERATATFALAESGLAGPIRGRSPKPVGSVWFAIATPDGVHSEERRFDGDREAIMAAITHHALAMLADALGLERDA